MFYKFTFEPAHDKTYRTSCVTRKDSDQPIHPLCMVRILVYLRLDSLEFEGTCDQRTDQAARMRATDD